MAKSRWRYWLGVGMLIGILITFFRMGTRQNLPRANHQIHRNGMPHRLSTSSPKQKIALDQPHDAPSHSMLASLIDHTIPARADSIFWISAQQAWDGVSRGEALMLDLRSYDDYRERHPRGAQSFSAARMPDWEAAFPDKNQNYILLHWPNLDMTAVTSEFARRGYRRLYALDMYSSRAGPYKMSEWEQEQLPVERGNVFQFGDAQIKLENSEIFRDSLGCLTTLAHLPAPTVELLLRYRPRLLEQCGYDEDNETFRSEIGKIESSIAVATLAGDKIWVGFSFYESERHQGYGGLGFYDVATGEIGILRHPALVNHSVKELMVTDEMIYLATIDEFELSREVGNGLVMIDRQTLQVSALIPPGAAVVWHKDGGKNVAQFYDKSIPEILADRRFVPKTVEGWEPSEVSKALNLGLERYMIQAAEAELNCIMPN